MTYAEVYIRGGSWNNRFVRAAVRDWFAPSGRDLDLGFRIVRSFDVF